MFDVFYSKLQKSSVHIILLAHFNMDVPSSYCIKYTVSTYVCIYMYTSVEDRDCSIAFFCTANEKKNVLWYMST